MAKQEIRPILVEGQVAYVPLTQGYTAIIDAADVHLVQGVNWHVTVARRADGTIRAVYATRGALGRTIYMHRVIAETPDGMDTDHRDGDGLNNRRHNLRSATRPQNQHNQRPRANASGAKGVTWHRTAGKWQASIRAHGVTHHLGLFRCTTAAALAYAKASAELHGDFGRAA